MIPALSSGAVLHSHLGEVEGSVLVFSVVLLATAGTGVLFAGSVAAWAQRRELRYLLIMTAVGALFVRSVVGIGTVSGVVPMVVHHFVEHSLDFSIAALVLYAVYRSGPAPVDADPDGETG